MRVEVQRDQGQTKLGETVEARFNIGELVRIKPDMRPGVVTGRDTWRPRARKDGYEGYMYWVRFARGPVVAVGGSVHAEGGEGLFCGGNASAFASMPDMKTYETMKFEDWDLLPVKNAG